MTDIGGETPPTFRRPRWQGGLTLLVVGITLALVTAVAVANWDKYQELFAEADPIPLLGALVLGLVGQFVVVLVAHQSLRNSGQSATMRSVYRVVTVGGLGKYIPGGVWQVGTQAGIGRIEGLNFRRSMLTWIDPTAYNLTIGAGMALLAATTVDYGLNRWMLLVLAVVALCASTNPARYAIYRLVRLVPKEENTPPFLSGWPVQASLTAVIVVMTGLAGLFVIASFPTLSGPNLIGAIAAFVGAWVLGLLAFPIPGGFGVREGALVLALAPWMDTPEAVLIAAASRLVAVAADLIGALVGAALVGSDDTLSGVGNQEDH